MVIDAIKELKAAKAKVAALEEQVATQLVERMTALPEEFGFNSMDDFIEALQAATGKPARKGARGAAKSGSKKRAKRTTITPEIKNRVKALVTDGKTGAEIAKEVGISLPSVQNIKRELGLVKKR